MTIISGIDLILQAAPVMPVLTIEKVEDALPLAELLVAAGLKVLEVTLRTPAAHDAIRAMQQVQGAIVGAGTVINAVQLEQAQASGARFAISPGATPRLLAAAQRSEIPLLPAVSSASDVMLGLEAGYQAFKFFPAQFCGGIGMLKALAGPFPGVLFCPTGGITEENFRDYLALPNVGCVGGSWMVPADVIRRKDWLTIRQLAERIGTLSLDEA